MTRRSDACAASPRWWRTVGAGCLAVVVLAASPLVASAAGVIRDNSFLVEEAYNQEPGVVHHNGFMMRSIYTGAWGAYFTEEWPLLGQTHQASVTFNLSGSDRASGIGDTAINYRWQALGDADRGQDGTFSLAPRVTLLLPTGNDAQRLGNGGTGIQVNLPLSVVLSDGFVVHSNAGATYVPSGRLNGDTGAIGSWTVGQSLVWLVHPNVNLLAEAVYARTAFSMRSRPAPLETLVVNPGVRGAIDLPGGYQIVPGVSLPIGIGPSAGEVSLLFYLSLEHPFRLAGPTTEEIAARRQAPVPAPGPVASAP